MALRRAPVLRIGTLSALLSSLVLYGSHTAKGATTPFATLLLGGCAFRCLTLPMTVYGDQCLSRMASALPELHVAHRQYNEIETHPKAIVWERRVAAQKLRNDRERIFRAHRTSNVKMMVPHLSALLASWYLLGAPSQQLGELCTEEAGVSVVSPLAISVLRDGVSGGTWSVTRTVDLAAASAASSPSASALLGVCTVDPTLAIAATLTLYNVWQHLSRREGFNDQLDAYIRKAKTACLCGYAVWAVVCLAGPPLAAASSFLPPYLGPVWLGMSVTSLIKSIFVHHTAPGRALCRLPQYPPTHGSYGSESTAESHEYRLAFTGVDAEVNRDIWQTQKRVLDYECDVRLHRLFAKTGLLSEIDEMEYEVERLKERRGIAVERAAERRAHKAAEEEVAKAQQETETEEKEEGAAAAVREEDGEASSMTGTQRRRAIREQRKRLRTQRYEAKERARAQAPADAAAAAKAAVKDGDDDEWGRIMKAFASHGSGRAPASSLHGATAPTAEDFAEQYMDQYNEYLVQRRLDRQRARESAYRQRWPLSSGGSPIDKH